MLFCYVRFRTTVGAVQLSKLQCNYLSVYVPPCIFFCSHCKPLPPISAYSPPQLANLNICTTCTKACLPLSNCIYASNPPSAPPKYQYHNENHYYYLYFRPRHPLQLQRNHPHSLHKSHPTTLSRADQLYSTAYLFLSLWMLWVRRQTPPACPR